MHGAVDQIQPLGFFCQAQSTYDDNARIFPFHLGLSSMHNIATEQKILRFPILPDVTKS